MEFESYLDPIWSDRSPCLWVHYQVEQPEKNEGVSLGLHEAGVAISL